MGLALKLLEKLYDTERKTLEDVKLIMETEHGLPEIPYGRSSFVTCATSGGLD